MIKIVAIAPADGWAFVERNGEICLIKPPYAQTGLTPSTADIARSAVEKFGFEASESEFSDWPSVVSHLRQVLLERHQNRAAKTVNEFGPEILASAPARLKSDMLARIKRELIPNREWESALQLLQLIQQSPGAMEDPELRNLIVQLLRECTVGLLKQEAERRQLLQETEVDLATQFPLLENTDAVKKLAQSVERRHQVFEVGVA